MRDTQKSANNGHAYLDGLDESGEVFIVDDVRDGESIPVFPVMKEQAPPIPPPVAELRPPVPPPVDAPPVQLVSLSSGSISRKRRFPRRQMSLVAAVLILGCFGLGSHDSKAPQSELLETTQVTISEPALPTPAQAGLSELDTKIDYVVEEINSDNTPPLLTAKALQDVETEAVDSKLADSLRVAGAESSRPQGPVAIDSKFADDRTETIEVAKSHIPLPNRPLPEGKEPVEPAASADHADEFDASPLTESETCTLTLDTKQLLGTEVRWAETANKAAMIADDQGKLVYLIQVSGNFEIPEFT